jgi:ABC-type branched-subunit amino acid transport system permease subunit
VQKNGGVHLKSYEVKRIGPGSIFKFNFVLGSVLGLIISLILVLAGVSLNSIGFQLGISSLHHIGLLQVGAIILGIIIGSLVYGLLMGLVGAIGALIYNAFAALVGGVVIKLNEKD